MILSQLSALGAFLMAFWESKTELLSATKSQQFVLALF